MVDGPAFIQLQAPRPLCTHHWYIEWPAGETSKGVCKLCGASRQFDNVNLRSMARAIRKEPGNRSG